MDVWTFIASIPGIGPYLPYIGALGVCCMAIAAVMPPPKSTTGTYFIAYKVVNYIGLNVGHARNATDPAVTKPVGQ